MLITKLFGGKKMIKSMTLTSVVNRGNLANGSNLNTLVNNGRWLLNHNGAYVNAPLPNEEAQVIVEQQGSVLVQFFIQQRDNGTNSTYKGFRTSSNSGTNWSEWREEMAIEIFADDPRKGFGDYVPTRIGQIGYCEDTEGFYLAYGTGTGEFIKIADETLIKNLVTVVVKPEVDVFGFVASKGTTVQSQGFSITSTSSAPIVSSNSFGSSTVIPTGSVGVEYYSPDTTDPSQNYIKLVDRSDVGMPSIARNLTAKDWQDIWDFGASIEVKIRADKTNVTDFLGTLQVFFGANNPGFTIGDFPDGTMAEQNPGGTPYGVNYPILAKRNGGNITYEIVRNRNNNQVFFSVTIPEDDWLTLSLKIDQTNPGHLQVFQNGIHRVNLPWCDYWTLIGNVDYNGKSTIGYSSGSSNNINQTDIQEIFLSLARTSDTLVIPNRQASFLVVLPVGAKDWTIELNEITEGGGAYVGSTVKILARNTGEVVVRPMTANVTINGLNAPIRFTNGSDRFNLTLEQAEVETGNEWYGSPVLASSSGSMVTYDSDRGIDRDADNKVHAKIGDGLEFNGNGQISLSTGDGITVNATNLVTLNSDPFDFVFNNGQIRNRYHEQEIPSADFTVAGTGLYSGLIGARITHNLNTNNITCDAWITASNWGAEAFAIPNNLNEATIYMRSSDNIKVVIRPGGIR